MTAPAPKPAKLPRWAETSPGTVSGDVVEPSAGKKDIGFVAGERPPAEYLDWLFAINYEWAAYLNDGDLTISGNTWPSTVGTLANAANDDWDPGGVGSLAGLGFIRLTGGGASAVLTSIANPVDGRVLILSNETGSPVGLKQLSGGTITNRLQVDSRLSASTVVYIPHQGVVALRYESGGGTTNRWRVIWSSVPLNEQTRTVTVPFFFNRVVTAGTITGSTGTTGATVPISTTARFPLDGIPTNAKIQSVHVYLGTTTGAGADYALQTSDLTSAGGVFADITGATTTTNASFTLTPTTPAVLSDGYLPWLKIVTNGTNTAILLSAVITYSMPT